MLKNWPENAHVVISLSLIQEGTQLLQTRILPGAQMCNKIIGSWLQPVELLTCLKKY